LKTVNTSWLCRKIEATFSSIGLGNAVSRKKKSRKVRKQKDGVETDRGRRASTTKSSEEAQMKPEPCNQKGKKQTI
jgi:hypothetical protein